MPFQRLFVSQDRGDSWKSISPDLSRLIDRNRLKTMDRVMGLGSVGKNISTTLFGAVWPEIYGLKHLGSIRALVFSAMVLASAGGPGITGYLIDRGISYPGQIVTMGLYCFAVSMLLFHVSRRVRARAAASA